MVKQASGNVGLGLNGAHDIMTLKEGEVYEENEKKALLMAYSLIRLDGFNLLYVLSMHNSCTLCKAIENKSIKHQSL